MSTVTETKTQTPPSAVESLLASIDVAEVKAAALAEQRTDLTLRAASDPKLQGKLAQLRGDSLSLEMEMADLRSALDAARANEEAARLQGLRTVARSHAEQTLKLAAEREQIAAEFDKLVRQWRAQVWRWRKITSTMLEAGQATASALHAIGNPLPGQAVHAAIPAQMSEITFHRFAHAALTPTLFDVASAFGRAGQPAIDWNAAPADDLFAAESAAKTLELRELLSRAL